MSFFLPYQKEWLLDNSRIKLMEKSRQIGMSWTSAYSLVRRHSLSTERLDSWVSSRDEVQASLFIEDCKKFAAILNIAFKEISGDTLTEDSAKSTKSLAFKNGTKIHSLSSNPDAQAGKRGSRILDEFALHQDSEKLYAIAYPGITWGGSLEIISTHRGSDSFFNKLVNEIKYGNNPKNISLHKVSLQDALEQGFLDKLKKALGKDNKIYDMDNSAYFDYIKNSCVDEESFFQEYMCQPANDNSNFIPFEVLEKNFYKQNTPWQEDYSKCTEPMFLGVDLARSRDYSVFYLLKKVGDIFYTIDIQSFKDTPFSEQESVLMQYLQNPYVLKVAIDSTGLGRQFAERAQSKFGKSRIESVNFTNLTKQILAYPLKVAMQNSQIRLPDTQEIRADFRNLKREFGSGSNINITAKHNASGHSDHFWALALAYYCAKDCKLDSPKISIFSKKNDYIW